MAFSYSRYSTYVKCPRKYKFCYVDYLPGNNPPSEAMQRGTDLHNSVEGFILGHREDLPQEIADYEPYFSEVKEQGAQPELRFAFDWDWKPCDYKSSDCMVRGFLDVFCPTLDEDVTVLELKTGKVYDEHKLQRDLYGVAGDLIKPVEDYIKVINVYLDQRKMVQQLFTKDDLECNRMMWVRNFEKVMSEKIFPPNPSYGCRWCGYSKEKGGPCRF